jgi:4-carboxymuconolactone decarboxylase
VNDGSAARLPGLTPGELDADQAALYEAVANGPRAQGPQHFAITAPDGSLNGPYNAFLYSPVLGNALQALGSAVRFSTDLTARTREIAILIVAGHWQSDFERLAHEGVGRAAGLTDVELGELWAGRLPVLADDHERACAEYVYAAVRGDVDDADWARLVPVIGSQAAFELSTLVGYYATLALQLRIFRVNASPPTDH